MNYTIDTVLIIFNPDIEMLKRCIKSINLQVRTIWIIDNNSKDNNIKDALTGVVDNIKFIIMSENKGIAYAQNVGIERSLKSNSDYILLSDQDTIYPKDYVEKMLFLFKNKPDHNVAAVAPLFHDTVGNNDNEGFVVLSKFGYSKVFPVAGCHQINQAIASGLVIKSSTLKAIGMMDAKLFIDWVDIEWCWRAIAKGYLILGNADVLIEHNLGDSVTKIGWYKDITIRSPIRHYYITRNAFYLAWQCPYLDFWHRLNLVYKGIRYIAGFSIFVKPRMTNLKMTLLGFYHGVIGRLGRLD